MKLIVGLENKKKVEIFSEICGLLKNLTEFIVLEFREEGLYSQGMGFDQISLYEFMIKKEWLFMDSMVDNVWICGCGSMNSPTLESCPQCNKVKENEDEKL